MKLLGVLLLPLNGIIIDYRSPLSSIFFRSFDKFAGTDSNFWVKRGTVGGSELPCPV